MEFVFLLLFFLFSVSCHLLLKIKIEQSLFFSVCLIFIIMLCSGLAADLIVGFYILIGLGALSLPYIIYKSVKKDIKSFEIITPGAVIFIAAFIVYYISTRGALLHLWDEATHWGIAAKKMYYSGDLWASGLQTIAPPLFNQLMLKLTGYKESALYLSQWTLYLSCIVLPLSGIGWKKSWLAAIYSAAVIFAVSSVFQDGNLTLYADGLLSFFFASLLLAWYLEKDNGYKRYIWAGAGLFMLVQVKSGSGLSLAAMFLAFALFSDTVLNPGSPSPQKAYLKNLKTFLIFAAVIFISNYSFGLFDKSFTGSDIGSETSGQPASSVIFIIFAALFAATVVLFALYTINVFAKKRIAPAKPINRLLAAAASLSFIAGVGVLFYGTLLRPNFDVTTTVINFFKAFQSTYVLGLPMMYLIAVIVALYIINTVIARKEERASFAGFYSAALFFSGLYIIGVLYAYLSSFGLGEAVNTASFDRYVGTAIMFATIFALMPLLKQNSAVPLKKMMAPYIVMFACAALLAANFTPSFRAAETTSKEASTFRQTEISGANQVREHVGSDGKVFLVIQEDRGFVFNWMRYEFTPITTNGGYWSFGEGGGWDFAWNEEKMKQFLHDAHYDYLYLFKSNDYFAQRFASLFGENPPESRTLYEFDYEGETVFTPVR